MLISKILATNWTTCFTRKSLAEINGKNNKVLFRPHSIHGEFTSLRLSDQQLIYYSKSIPKVKRGIHKRIRCRSLKNYSVHILEEALGRLDFRNGQKFENINDIYSNFI